MHPTAQVHATARLGAGVVVGPYAVIGPSVEIGAGTRLAAHAVVERDTTIGSECEIGVGVVVGGAPQDRTYGGAPTRVEIGDGTSIREYSTVNRGSATGVTRIGRRCFLMTYVHVAHDCRLDDDVTLANFVQLAGHVHVEAGATLGGTTAVQQFVRIGTLAFVGGASRVVADVPPYMRAAGNPLRWYGVNTVGLTRANTSRHTRQALKHAYRLLFNSDLVRADALAQVRDEAADVPEVSRLADFLDRAASGAVVEA